MSKAPQHRKPPKTPARPEKPAQRPSHRRLLVAVALVVLAGIPFALGRYFEFKYPDPFDSGAYVYSAKHVLSGARIGYEENPTAQTGTLLVNMLGVAMTGFNETGAKLLQTIFQAAALAFMFVTVRRLWGTLAGVVSVTIASIYLSAPLIAKFGNVKEQHMIAFMIAGVCAFVFYQLTTRWWWAVLSGLLLVWGPMFKPTGVSAVAAVGLFVLAQPILRHYSWKRAGKEVLLLVAGAAITLAPIVLWYASMDTPPHYYPYSFIIGPVLGAFSSEPASPATPATAEAEAPTEAGEPEQTSLILRLLPSYVSDSWEALDPAGRRAALVRVLRYYRLLILPIALALAALVARIVVLIRRKRPPKDAPLEQDTGRLVPLLAIWWLLDMAFVWISPRSYEQYYLPLNASAAMLGGYFVHLYAHRLHTDREKTRWVVLGLLSVIAMMIMSWHIFFGISRSPHSGVAYRDPRTGEPSRRRGYVQKWQEIAQDPTYPWQQAGTYIRERTDPNDPIYVWGWVPGIYVEAQRMSPTATAFEGTMHTLPPEDLADRAQGIVDAFEEDPPKFIVDTRKRHFPWDRPPLELWPRTRQGFLPANEQVMRQYDQLYAKSLREQIEPAEGRRFEAMRPLRWYVMKNYEIAGQFGEHVLFRRKQAARSEG